MNTVTILECNRIPAIDPAPLSEIYRNLGDKGAEETICRGLENLAIRLNLLRDSRAVSGFEEIARQSQRIVAVARGIGLTEVATTARYVATCARQTDGYALKATLGLLTRGLDLAIGWVWDMRDF